MLDAAHGDGGRVVPGFGQRLGDQTGREQCLRYGIMQLAGQAGALFQRGGLMGTLVEPRVLQGQRDLVGEGLHALQIGADEKACC